jgi:predicted alpha/beta superfamily hydrolase
MKKYILFLFVISIISCQTQEKKDSKIVIKTDHGIQLGSGTIQRIDSFPSKNIVPRTVDIWLPDNYSSDKKYAVLYMHDGQMLFDSLSTWNKQEWKVDEWAGQLQKEGKTKDFIIVAPHNISKIRWNDYFPEKAFNYLSKSAQDSLKTMAKKNNFEMTMNADEYLKFLTQELKPYIDQNYSVHTDKANTVVSGSSMGGLISMYAISEYPDVFGAAACISTHWPGAGVYEGNPMPEAIFAYMKKHTPSSKDHRLYFDYGTKTLDQFYPQYAETVNKIYTDNGYDSTNFVNRLFEGADHSENSWNQRLDIPFIFLLGK